MEEFEDQSISIESLYLCCGKVKGITFHLFTFEESSSSISIFSNDAEARNIECKIALITLLELKVHLCLTSRKN